MYVQVADTITSRKYFAPVYPELPYPDRVSRALSTVLDGVSVTPVMVVADVTVV